MLSKPKNGWSDLKICGFEMCISDIQDIPTHWLQACLFGLDNRLPITWYFDTEGTVGYVILDGGRYILLKMTKKA